MTPERNFDPEKTMLEIAWSNNYKRDQSEQIINFLSDHPDLILMADIIQDGLKGRINPFELSTIVSRSDRFGDYDKSIRAILENQMDPGDFAKLSLATRIDIETLESQSAFIGLVLENSQAIYRKNGLDIPPEIDLDKPKNGASIQYLTQLFTLICVGYKKPGFFGRKN